MYILEISRWIFIRIRSFSKKKIAENIKTKNIMYNIFFPRKSCLLWDNMEKYDTFGQATNDNKIRRLRLALWMNKAADTSWEYAKFLAFPRQNDYANAPHCYVDMYIDYLCSASYYYRHHSAVNLTCPQPLPGRVLYRVRSIVSSFNFQ